MRLAISNIAWTPAERDAAHGLLAELGVRGLEIAVGLAFPEEADPFDPSPGAVREFQGSLATNGLSLVSMQSLLFGVADAQLFGTPAQRQAFEAGVGRAIRLAGRLEIPNLVLGSPTNRAIPEGRPRAEAELAAAEVFRRLGDACLVARTRLALEPNPAAYGTNFLNTLEETVAFAEVVDHPAVTVNFDIGALHMNGEGDRAAALYRHAAARVSHVHISEPGLAPAPADAAGFEVIARGLIRGGYEGWASIEMRAAGGDNLARVRASVTTCAKALARAEAA